MNALVAALLLAQAPVSAPPEVVQESGSASAGHFAGAFVGALAGAAPAAAVLAGAIHLSSTGRVSDLRMADPLKPIGLVLLPLGASLGGYLGHRWTGGKGGLGTAMISAAAATGISLLTVGFYTFAVDNPRWTPQQRFAHQGPIAIAGLLAPVLTVATALQIHHGKAIRVTAAPIPGGGSVGVSGAF